MFVFRVHCAAGLLACCVAVTALLPPSAVSGEPSIPEIQQANAIARLTEIHGPGHQARIQRGVTQAAKLWREEDGAADDFLAFVEEHFITDPKTLETTFGHLQYSMEMIDGHLNSIRLELRHYMDEDRGPILPVDRLLGGWDVSAHVNEDMFGSKIAFATLLNFPQTTLDERLAQGASWTRDEWARVRLVDRFTTRIPAHANQAVTTATSQGDAYIAGYNIHMHHLLTPEGERLFPPGLRLITHWNLRDELKAQYSAEDGLARQRMIYQVLDAITRQTIPAAVIDNPLVDWTPATGTVTPTSVEVVDPPPGKMATSDSTRENDVRYELLLSVFRAMQEVDRYSPDLPTHIARSFEGGREIPEAQVEDMFLSLFDNPVAVQVADLIERRLGRPLEPFDIWYAGFKPRAEYQESELDAITKERYPTPEAFEKDIPRILRDLGFSREKAELVADHIVVDPSRGAGHAWGAQRRDDKAHLRTRVGPDGMDYKGYNIAVHELGHNVEQVFSLTTIDHTLLSGVPGNGFTEALAMVFQARDLELLGLSTPSEETRHLHALEEYWATCEIGAVALVDMGVWRWMYEHPEATAAELREATVAIAEDVWSRTFGPLMKDQSSVLLACYSHMLGYPLYLPNYPLGHLIAFQLEEHFRDADFGAEFERVCQQGRVTPDQWMVGAVGEPLSARPLIDAAARAVTRVQ
jgi:hypothetical protein